MELRTYWGDLIFSVEGAKTILELVNAARSANKSLRGADLRGAVLSCADLSGADLRGAVLSCADLSGADLSCADLSCADLSGADLSGAFLSGAVLSGAVLRGAVLSGAFLSGAVLGGAFLRGAVLSGAVLGEKKVQEMKVLTGLYRYEVWAVLFQDGSRWIRMGCLWRSLEEWDAIGIRKSNLSEFPDDGSDKCEERVAAFEFAKAAVLRMKMPDQQ